jgi:hypothetical protein
MFEYINTKTGARISSPDVLSGENWELYEGIKATDREPIEPTDNNNNIGNTEVEESVLAPSEITKKEIIAELEALGVEYDPKAKKDDLYKLMMGE